MQLRTALVRLLLGIFATFIAVNWNAVSTPTTLSFVAGTVQFPLGLLLLAFTARMVAPFVVLLLAQLAGVISHGAACGQGAERAARLG